MSSDKKKLKKELSLLGVIGIATGTTISSGFFLLPGLAASMAGSGLIFAYLLAAVPLIPAMFSIVELATAMPRAGGVYYFMDRTLGPMFGTIGGVGTFLSLILKVSFALIGMGAYINLFFPDLPIVPIALVIALVLGAINIKGASSGSRMQIVLVAALLLILVLFIGYGGANVNFASFRDMFGNSFEDIASAAGFVYISYIGITKVASLSEEVKNPEKNLPLGIFISLGTALVVYVLGTAVMVGLIPIEELSGALTPAALAAEKFAGKTGVILISIAALASFISVANAGTLSASRYPLAMSRDHLLPLWFRRLSKSGNPNNSLVVTVLLIMVILVLFDPTKIAKLASAFQLVMFAFVCLAVIVMRESKIESYDPGYKSPFYPYMQIAGILAPMYLISKMGWLSIMFSLGLVLAAVLWYNYYGQKRVSRNGAIYHIFERLGRSRFIGLDRELREILKEKGLRKHDPFDEIVLKSKLIDLDERADFEELSIKAAEWLAQHVPHTAEEINKQFVEGNRIGATPVTHGVALPHLRIDGLDSPKMVIVRGKKGISITFNNPLTDHDEETQIISAVFFLASPDKDHTQHLRMLAQIAGRVDEESFAADWDSATSELEIKSVMLRHDNYMSLIIGEDKNSNQFTGKMIKEADFPENCLVAMIVRNGESIIPRGSTVIREGDRLTIISDPTGIRDFNKLLEMD